MVLAGSHPSLRATGTYEVEDGCPVTIPNNIELEFTHHGFQIILAPNKEQTGMQSYGRDCVSQ